MTATFSYKFNEDKNVSQILDRSLVISFVFLFMRLRFKSIKSCATDFHTWFNIVYSFDYCDESYNVDSYVNKFHFKSKIFLDFKATRVVNQNIVQYFFLWDASRLEEASFPLTHKVKIRLSHFWQPCAPRLTNDRLYSIRFVASL